MCIGDEELDPIRAAPGNMWPVVRRLRCAKEADQRPHQTGHECSRSGERHAERRERERVRAADDHRGTARCERNARVPVPKRRCEKHDREATPEREDEILPDHGRASSTDKGGAAVVIDTNSLQSK